MKCAVCGKEIEEGEGIRLGHDSTSKDYRITHTISSTEVDTDLVCNNGKCMREWYAK